ncbi:MAG: ABC transporter permease [Chloroflexaceae bacterium]|nr:ABC transporter permease [Chloroflexaceae bacterium]
MLNQWIPDPLWLGIAQAAIALVLALLVLLVLLVTIARFNATTGTTAGDRLGQDTLMALARGLIQIILVGLVLGLLLDQALWTGGVMLLVMMTFAANIAQRRARGTPGAFGVALVSIAGGAGSVVALMTWLGVIEPTIASLIPIGSIIVAGAMQSCGQALDRLQGEVRAHSAEIEAGLALGAAPSTTMAPFVQAAMLASLIPRLDILRSLGIVWIPGIMAGMILGGIDPIYAALYQFVIMALVFATATLTVCLTMVLMQKHFFTPAEQLSAEASPSTRG